MICCDRCEEWFHGDCVGITEARGRLMERNGEDYICPNCNASKCQTPRSSAAPSSLGTENGRRIAPSASRRAEHSPSALSSPTAEEKTGEDLGIKGRIEKATNPSGKKKIKIFQPVCLYVYIKKKKKFSHKPLVTFDLNLFQLVEVSFVTFCYTCVRHLFFTLGVVSHFLK